MDNPTGFSPVLYVKVNCSGAVPVVTYNGNPVASCPPFSGLQNQAFVVTGHGGVDHTSLAVSKIYTGSGSTAKRFLFSVSQGSIVRSDITNTGITAGVTVVTAATLGLGSDDFVSFEAEISWGSNYFAWSAYNGTVHVIQVLTGNYTIGSLQNYSISGARGIEFNNVSTTPTLYASGTAGITKILTATQATSSVSTPGFSLTNTFLEYGKNNRIYGISPTYSGDVLTGTTFVNISATPISSFNPGVVDSRFTEGFLGQSPFFTLPDQIDGENYSYLNGTPAVGITNFTLNGSVPPGNCDEGTGNYCQNNTMTFNATYTGGTPSQYKFDIQAISNCGLITGAGLINYHGSWTAGSPAANLDLRTLTDANGKNLGNTLGGMVQITYSVQNACGFVSAYTRWINIYIPVPPVTALQLYNKSSPQNYLPVSQNISSPVLVGTASIGYRVNNSTGTITSLRVIIDEITSAGVLVGNIYDRTTTVNGVSGLTLENLNGYCVSSTVWGGVNPGSGSSCNVGYAGYTGYFSYTNGQLSFGRYYKLTITLGNICSLSTNWSYLYVNSIGNRMANSDESSENEKDISVYPNPASDVLTVVISAESGDSYEIEVTDMLGRQAMLLMPATRISEGVFKKSFDISQLQNGIYTYRIKSGSGNHSGIFSKN